MLKFKQIKGASFIMPITYAAHVIILNFSLYSLTPETYLHLKAIVGYNFAWLTIALILNFYSVERKERFITRFHKFVRHYFIFSLAYISIFSFLGENFSTIHQLSVLTIIFILLATFRWFFFYFRRLYRVEGGNYVNIVVVGNDKNLGKILQIFKEPDYGYRYRGYFSNRGENSGNNLYLGKISECYKYILDNRIDEIYCLVSELSNSEIKGLIHFADNNFKRLKLVPDNKGIFTRAMQAELFGTIPILNLRRSPLEMNYAKYGKRLFDILFSSLVILLILSWLIPLVYIAMRMESAGPLFFRQRRHGYNRRSFWCYKFRSMTVNGEANSKMCIKNDPRVTKLGKFLRKTSLDEFPQFFNVFMGDMSVVGPRPHMEAHTLEYSRSVNKYLVRHFAKPGITGLAQIKGYRGEIVTRSDIINRTRLDIFYLEKWCPILDFKIIYYTIWNCIRGEEKAF